MSITVTQKLSRFYHSKQLPWIIIFIGIVLRLSRYLYNPSLWFDEARNSLGYLEGSVSEYISTASDYLVTSPVVFFIFERISVQVFGSSEYALRLYPLLCGVLSLFLFYRVAKYYIDPGAIPIALGLFAILDPLITFSSEVKPYTSDLAVTLMIYIAIQHLQVKKFNTSGIMVLGIVGAAGLWMSHPSLFVLAGTGLTLAISCFVKKDWPRIGRLSVAYVMWGISFLTVFFLFTKPLMAILSDTNTNLVLLKRNAFMPFPPTSIADIHWFIDILFKTLKNGLGFTLSGIAALCFITGCISFFRKKKESFYMLIAPVLIALLASSLKKYAFEDRLVLFLIPSILIFIAEGTEFIRNKISDKSVVIGIIFVGLLFLHPLVWSTYRAMKPTSAEEIKPVMQYVKNNWQQGDFLYVYYMSQFAFEYYSKYYPEHYRFEKNEYVYGNAHRNWYASYKRKEFAGFWKEDKPFYQSYTSIFKEYVDDLNNLRGRARVWVLFSSNVPKEGINEEKFFIYHLETIGEQLDFFGHPGNSSVYLYDLTVKSK